MTTTSPIRIATLVACLCALLVPAAAQAPQRPPLPDLPATPVLDDRPFPDCRHDYRQRSEDFERAAETTACIEAIDAYHDTVMVPFTEQMLAHQEVIAEIYENQVRNNFDYSQAQADGFFERVTAEHEASNPDGAHYAAYRQAEARYNEDRAFLQERFCRYSGQCADYAETEATAERDAADGLAAREIEEAREEREELARAERRERERQERRERGGSDDCGTERAGGGILGGILGAVVGEATGVGALAGTLIGQAAGVLVADIACQLEPAEQEKAVEATEKVLEEESVGATAEWVSPTRADVSGSSTVTALNSQPNGATCLDITDIVIIEGEETRVEKTMCRQPGETRYTLQA